MAWNIVEPEKELLLNWHLEILSEYLSAVSIGQIRRLIINMPPRYGKSNIVTVAWPTWEWIQKPELRHLCMSYSQSLSTKHSIDRRAIMQSDWYQKCFGHVFKLTSDQNVKTEFVNNKRGMMLATSVGGTLTGKGGDRLIFDDPHNPQQTLSDIQRRSAIEFFENTAYTRLNDKKNGVIIIVMQRLHEDDLTGHLLAKDAGYEHLKLQGICTSPKTFSYPISGKTKKLKLDEPLHSEREGIKELAETKKSMGTYNFEGQYQQEPAPPEGGAINKYWFNFYQELPVRDELMTFKCQSWDLSFKDLKTNSFVVGQVWYSYKANKFLISLLRKHLDFTETLKAITSMTAKFPNVHAKYIEDKANGPAVMSALQNSVSGIIPVSVSGSKEARLAAISPQIEAGNIFLPCLSDPTEWNKTPVKIRTREIFNSLKLDTWVEEFIHECALFPFGKHDDQVDAMSQAISKISDFSVSHDLTINLQGTPRTPSRFDF